jgi:hypothetical protein
MSGAPHGIAALAADRRPDQAGHDVLNIRCGDVMRDTGPMAQCATTARCQTVSRRCGNPTVCGTRRGVPGSPMN